MEINGLWAIWGRDRNPLQRATPPSIPHHCSFVNYETSFLYDNIPGFLAYLRNNIWQ